MSFEARYAGLCAECDERFPVGTMIRYNDEDEIVHADCYGGDIEADDDVCPDCHLVHTGECW